MGYLFRHVLAVLVLPVMMVVVVPIWIGWCRAVVLTWPGSWTGWSILTLGAVFLAVGSFLFVASLRGFGVKGMGTLAPWDPPARLVVDGPYAHVRNPMISGVVLMLIGEALALRSVPHLAWAGIFAGLNALYILLIEEPGLRSRFGAEYDEYSRHVPRLIPRVRPWRFWPGSRSGE